MEKQSIERLSTHAAGDGWCVFNNEQSKNYFVVAAHVFASHVDSKKKSNRNKLFDEIAKHK